MKKHILLNSMLFAIQASLSVTFAVYILKLNVLPDSVNIICLICLGLAMISSAFLLLGKTKIKRIMCTFIAGILSIIMLIPIGLLMKTDHTLLIRIPSIFYNPSIYNAYLTAIHKPVMLQYSIFLPVPGLPHSNNLPFP